jgi:hypothetical protein
MLLENRKRRSRISVREDIFDARGDPGSEAGKTMLKRQSPPPQKKRNMGFSYHSVKEQRGSVALWRIFSPDFFDAIF